MPVSPARVREALEARASAHEHDKNFDGAVADLRAALDKAPAGEKAQELQQRLSHALDRQRRWQCVDPSDRKAWQDNRCGHPGDPKSGRDHRAVLELPANLDQLAPEAQCGWVNRQYRIAASQETRVNTHTPRSYFAHRRANSPSAPNQDRGPDRAALRPRLQEARARVAPRPVQGRQGESGAEDARVRRGEGGAREAAAVQ